MTQQEIFQNMTKGEWNTKTSFRFNRLHQDAKEKQPLYDSMKMEDGYAVCSAVNNTYGKSINPESVEKMKETIQALHDILESRTYLDAISIAAYKTILEEALTAAKL